MKRHKLHQTLIEHWSDYRSIICEECGEEDETTDTSQNLFQTTNKHIVYQ